MPASSLARPGAARNSSIAVFSDASLRPQALRYLLDLAPSLAPSLAESLRDPDPDVRRLVADMMGFSRDAKVVPALEAATKDPDAAVVAAAQRADRSHHIAVMARLPRAFYARPTLAVAPDLLGKVLVHRTAAGRTAGIIVEVEAYIGESDPACHAAAGPTRRNAPLYGPPGHAYVYLNYGVHCLMNVVTEPDASPAAVLIRALEPLDGISI